MGLWDWLLRDRGLQPREMPPVPRVFNMLLDNAQAYGAAWVELVVDDRDAFRWDAPHEPLEDDRVSGIYYCVPDERLLDALIPVIVHEALVDYAEENCESFEASGGGTSVGAMTMASSAGPDRCVEVLVERDHLGVAQRLVLQIRHPGIDDELDRDAAATRPEGARPVRIDVVARPRAVRPLKT